MNIEDPEGESAAFLEALDRGLDLFNRQQFFEAYEVWSERWSEEITEGADLLQGLIQVAVGFAKLEGGSPQGTVKLLQSGAAKLELYAPSAYGIDVTALLELLERWRQVAEQMIARGGAAGIELPPVTLSRHTDPDDGGNGAGG